MDRYLRPERFDADANSPCTTRQWNHWLTTFSNFPTSIEDHKPNQLQTLINYISPAVFEFIVDCADNDSAIKTLESIYNKTKNEIFARHFLPLYVHTDRGSSFMSQSVRDFLSANNIATSRTTPYNPQGNGQVERLNGTHWKSIILTLHSRNLDVTQWEPVLLDALHSIRSLLCTATNATPHERMFMHIRKSSNGSSLPSWLTTPGPVLMRRSVRNSKYDPLVDEVELLDCNPQYARVRFPDGREDTVSIRNLAPAGDQPDTPILPNPHHSQQVSDPPSSVATPGLTTADYPPVIKTPASPTENPPDPSELYAQQKRFRPYGLRNRDD